MKEFIEKLISRLEESVSLPKMERMESRVGKKQTQGFGFGVRSSVEIVNQLAEEYKHCALCYLGSPCEYQNENAILPVSEFADDNGWIPCSERLPEKLEPVNVTWVNRKPEPYYAHIKDIPFVATAFYYNGKWWWYSCVCEDYLSEYGESECDAVDKDIDIIAWQPLSQPYQPKG